MQTSSLSVADRVRASWPKLRKGLSYRTVERLIGPFPEMVKGQADWNELLESPEGGGVHTSLRFNTALYELQFENSTLVNWQLK
jgi:hypothetical protein